jgi:hypothetical protein
MQAESIARQTLTPEPAARACTRLLPGAIPGATVYHHVLPGGDAVQFMADPSFLRILFLCEGAAAFSVSGRTWNFAHRAVFVPAPEQTADVKIVRTARLLEIRWALLPADRAELADKAGQFPIAQAYADALQYRDPFKSEKTISRAILPHRLLPRFAMGSVETYADDLIGQHEHPLLDQFFFSFPENRMTLLIDDLRLPMGPDTLLHVHLGSNHGVSVTGDEVAHYLWIDFIPDPEKGNAYLDAVHKPTGEQCSFGGKP